MRTTVDCTAASLGLMNLNLNMPCAPSVSDSSRRGDLPIISVNVYKKTLAQLVVLTWTPAQTVYATRSILIRLLLPQYPLSISCPPVIGKHGAGSSHMNYRMWPRTTAKKRGFDFLCCLNVYLLCPNGVANETAAIAKLSLTYVPHGSVRSSLGSGHEAKERPSSRPTRNIPLNSENNKRPHYKRSRLLASWSTSRAPTLTETLV